MGVIFIRTQWNHAKVEFQFRLLKGLYKWLRFKLGELEDVVKEMSSVGGVGHDGTSIQENRISLRKNKRSK